MADTATLSKQESTAAMAGPTLDTRVQPALEELARLPDSATESRTRVRNDVVNVAMPLADRLARRFTRRGESIDDLTQVARLALVRAVDKFDTQRGTGLTQFAVPSILGELKRHFRDKGWTMRVPRRLQETRLALNEAAEDLPQRLGRTPTDADYAKHLSISVDQVEAGNDCRKAYTGVSLSAPMADSSGEVLADSLGESDQGLEAAEDRQTLLPLTRSLSEHQMTMLILRYVHDMTQSQIARRVGMSQMHVSRQLRQSLDAIREDRAAQEV